MSESVFATLNKINVNDHTEKKNGLTYLSWAWAWAEAKKAFPGANYKVYEAADGCFYFHDNNTCWVKVSVTIEDIEHIEYLPVMDYKNKSIPLLSVTSMDVNKAIQRALTKALARHGLGLYIYAGEDIPEEDANKAENELKYKRNAVIERCKAEGISSKTIMSLYKAKSMDSLTAAQCDNIIANIEKIKEMEDKK